MAAKLMHNSCFSLRSTSDSKCNISLGWYLFLKLWNLIGGVMVSVLASCAVDRGIEHRSGQNKDYGIVILLLLRYARRIKE